MFLAFINLWNIVDKFEEVPPSNANSKVNKEYQRHIKKVIFIIGLNFTDNRLVHIKNCKGHVKKWKTLCNIHKTKSLSNILFVHPKLFTCNIQKDDDLLDHVNKVKALTNQLICLEVPVRDKNIIMTLFKSLQASYEYLITAL